LSKVGDEFHPGPVFVILFVFLKMNTAHFSTFTIHHIHFQMPDTPDRNRKKRQHTGTEALPLGWTKISRQRNGATQNKGNAEDISFVYCCEDPKCRVIPHHPSSNVPLTPSKILLKGSAFFCLHSLSTKWFQGQFVPKSGGKPFALLATQRDDVDDCLQCADNGYREIDLTIFSRFYDRDGGRAQLKLPKIPCTGGDMLRMAHEECNLVFDAQRIFTGIKAVPLVEKYFRNIIHKIEVGRSLLDVLPEVAIVVGDMTLSLEKDFVQNNYRQKMEESFEKDDGWLSD
jgi:hypothetical protein